MWKLLAIGIGGFVGAVGRYGASGLAQGLTKSGFPVGTLVVNAIGCLAIGAMATLVEDGRVVSENARAFIQIGLLGSFTTFSTFGWETYAALRDGDTVTAVLNVALSVGVGVAAVLAGRALVIWLWT